VLGGRGWGLHLCLWAAEAGFEDVQEEVEKGDGWKAEMSGICFSEKRVSVLTDRLGVICLYGRMDLRVSQECMGFQIRVKKCGGVQDTVRRVRGKGQEWNSGGGGAGRVGDYDYQMVGWILLVGIGGGWWGGDLGWDW